MESHEVVTHAPRSRPLPSKPVLPVGRRPIMPECLGMVGTWKTLPIQLELGWNWAGTGWAARA